jgi:hypothetical protein
MGEKRPKLEKQGWNFISVEEVLAKKYVGNVSDI